MNVAPFDRVAAGYDAAFTDHPLGRLLREAVWRSLDNLFRPGDRVLELGCGTGEDAARLAARGINVHATDASEAMLDVARRKASLRGVDDRVTFDRVDLATPALPAATFDGCFSNFGALNAVACRRPLARSLAQAVVPGGHAMMVVMGPLCPWEWGWYLPQGRVRTALRRFRRGGMARLDDGTPMHVWYPSPWRLRRELAPYFEQVSAQGIGVLLPPTFGQALVDRWPRFFERLARLDPYAGSTFPGTWLNDHYLIVFERTNHTVV